MLDRIKNLFRREPEVADQQAAPPADSGKTIDVAAITKTVTDEVMKGLKPFIEQTTAKVADLVKTTGELAGNHKVLADTLAANKPFTQQDAEKLIGESVEKLFAARQQSADSKAERDAFIASEASGLAKLPAVYKAKLGADKAKWAEEAKAIASEFEADFKASGGKVADVGGATRDGGTPPAATQQTGFLKMPA